MRKIIIPIKSMLPLLLLLLFGLCFSGCGAPAPDTEDSAKDGGEKEEPVTVNLLDYKSPETTDWAYAMKSALRDGDIVYVPAGVYPIGKVVVPSGKTITGDGDKTVFQATSESTFVIEGAAGGEVPIAADMKDFSGSFTLSKKLNLKEGDLIYLLSQRSCMLVEDAGRDWCLGRSYYKGGTGFFGEFLTVAASDNINITTTTDTIYPFYYADGSRESLPPQPKEKYGVTDWPYTRQSTTVAKVIPAENVLLKDFAIEQNSGVAISFGWARNCAAENITLLTAKDKPLELKMNFIKMRMSIGCEARNCSAFVRGGISIKGSDGSDFYSANVLYLITSCTESGFVGCYADAGSHSFMISKTNKSGPSTDCYIKNCTAKNAVWSGFYVSQSCYRTVVSGCTALSCGTGISVAGRASLIENNHIDLSLPLETSYYYVRPAEGGTSGIMLNEGYSIDSVIRNNTIKNAYSAILVRDGYEDTNIFEFGKITVAENTVENCKYGFYSWKNTHNKGRSDMGIVVEGNSFRGVECGVFIADMLSGVTARGNLFEDAGVGVYAGSFSGGIAILENTFRRAPVSLEIKAVPPALAGTPQYSQYKTDISFKDNSFEGCEKTISGASQVQVIYSE